MIDGIELIYLAGPMRGYDHYNFPAFYAAAEDLRSQGYGVLSPAEHDTENGFDVTATLEENEFDLQEAMRWDLSAVCQADAVVVLPGWRESTGVGHEVAVAEVVGSPVLAYPGLEPVTPEPISLEAARLVAGPRQGAYGHPAEDFSRTGWLWAGVLAEWAVGCAEKHTIEPIPAHLVGLCQVTLKISRQINAHKRDNLVDIAGYAETVRLVEERLPR